MFTILMDKQADIMALFPSGYLVIIQAKTSKRKFKKEKEEFMAHKGIQDKRIIWIWATPKHYKEDLKEIEEVVKWTKKKRLNRKNY